VIMYGGADGSRAYVESIRDPRVYAEFEPARAGKWRAFNRAIEIVRGEVVFLVSGDIRFSPEVLDHLYAQFTPSVGVVFPRVVPTNVGNAVTQLGAALWDVHDAQIVECHLRGMTVHGGELQAVRRTVLEPLEGVVNEDAYLCLRAAKRGFRNVYDRDAVVYNTVPETLEEFLAQRTRVNYGHRQLADAGQEPSTLDRLIWSRPEICVRVLAHSVRDRPVNALRLPFLAMVELWALARGNRDFARHIDYSRWALIRSGKGGAAHADD
jgi:glycosyltransferase involved in cell wall biosynthesis